MNSLNSIMILLLLASMPLALSAKESAPAQESAPAEESAPVKKPKSETTVLFLMKALMICRKKKK